MPNRTAIATEADIKRAIRAAQACGLAILRVVARPDGIAIETDKAPTFIAKPIAETPASQVDSTWEDVDRAS